MPSVSSPGTSEWGPQSHVPAVSEQVRSVKPAGQAGKAGTRERVPPEGAAAPQCQPVRALPGRGPGGARPCFSGGARNLPLPIFAYWQVDQTGTGLCAPSQRTSGQICPGPPSLWRGSRFLTVLRFMQPVVLQAPLTSLKKKNSTLFHSLHFHCHSPGLVVSLLGCNPSVPSWPPLHRGPSAQCFCVSLSFGASQDPRLLWRRLHSPRTLTPTLSSSASCRSPAQQAPAASRDAEPPKHTCFAHVPAFAMLFPFPDALTVRQPGNPLLSPQDPVEVVAPCRSLCLSSPHEHVTRAANAVPVVCFAVDTLALDPVCLLSCVSQDRHSLLFVLLGPHAVLGVYSRCSAIH